MQNLCPRLMKSVLQSLLDGLKEGFNVIMTSGVFIKGFNKWSYKERSISVPRLPKIAVYCLKVDRYLLTPVKQLSLPLWQLMKHLILESNIGWLC